MYWFCFWLMIDWCFLGYYRVLSVLEGGVWPRAVRKERSQDPHRQGENDRSVLVRYPSHIFSYHTFSYSLHLLCLFHIFCYHIPFVECCGAKNISFGSAEPQIQVAAPAPAPDSFKDTLKITFLDLSNRMKMLKFTKTSSATMIFSIKFLQVCGK
jgi:hypothetical protein